MKLPEQASRRSTGSNGYRRHLKRVRIRAERRRAKLDPEAIPTYNRYRGYED